MNVKLADLDGITVERIAIREPDKTGRKIFSRSDDELLAGGFACSQAFTELNQKFAFYCKRDMA